MREQLQSLAASRMRRRWNRASMSDASWLCRSSRRLGIGAKTLV
jgi:hypothetical protein